MPKSHPPYSAEFRAEALRLVRTSGKTKTAIAQDLGISLRRCAPGCARPSSTRERHYALTSEELAELRRLRREVKILREEREILVKAAAFFGSPFVPPSVPPRAGDQLTPMRKYEFVEHWKAAFPIRRLCCALGVSPSAWSPRRRPQSGSLAQT